jgi:Phage tail lysozyme/LysM domain
VAAPALAVSGALAAAPQAFAAAHALAATTPEAHTATFASGAHRTTAHLDAAVRSASQTQKSYTVHNGDTLFGIAQRFYGAGDDWPTVFHQNNSEISDPNLIFPGEVLAIPADATSSDPSSQSGSGGQTSGQQDPAASSQSSSGSTSGSTSGGSSGSSSGSSSASASASVQQDISNGNNLLAVAQFLVQNGYSKAAAAGVASCIDGESGGNPESVGSGGGGLIGWTPISSAQPNANIVTGNVEQDMMTQLSDLLFYDSNEIGQSQVSELNAQTDPVAAADFYSQNFERPAVTDSDVVPSVAEQVFSELGG